MHATTSRRPSSLLALIVGVLVLVLAGAPAAHACSCMGYTFDESAERADLIADITIVHEVEEDSGHVTYLAARSEEHTSELQSRGHLVCRLLLEKKKNYTHHETSLSRAVYDRN